MHTFKLKKGFIMKVSGVPVVLLKDTLVGAEVDLIGGKMIDEDSVAKVRRHDLLRAQTIKPSEQEVAPSKVSKKAVPKKG